MVRLLMANPAEITQLPFIGKGHTRHVRRGYQPGEFRTLANCEILEDATLINRRPVRTVHPTPLDTATTEYKNMDGFVGQYKDFAVLAGADYQKIVRSNPVETGSPIFNVADLQTGLSAVNGEWRKIVAFHRYNKTNYWITQCWFYNGGSDNCDVEYAVYWAKDPVGGSILNITFAMLTKVVIFRTTDANKDGTRKGVFKGPQHPTFAETENGSTVDAVTPETFPRFRASFIHKDRLWIFTDLKCYFSKTGDPTVWTAPDGGMFNFLEYTINDAVGHKDTIYIACDGSIFALNYTSDPNTNATLKQISSSQGGDSICLCGDTVYFARDDGLFAVSDQSITRVLELDIFAAPETVNYNPPSWKLISVNNYIVAWLVVEINTKSVIWPLPVSFDPKDKTKWSGYRYYHKVGYYPCGSEEVETYQHGAFFINTKNGSIHAFSTVQFGNYHDFFFVSDEDSLDNQVLYFTTEQGAYVGGGGVRYTVQWPHYITWSLDEIGYSSVYDQVHYDATQIVNLPVPWNIEISDFTPDGNEYFNKRFRSLIIEGDLRYYVEIYIAYDNAAYPAFPLYINETAGLETTLINSGNTNRNPTPVRLPLNQKAKSISMRIRRGNLLPPLTANKEKSGMAIRSIALLWTPSARGIPTRHTPV